MLNENLFRQAMLSQDPNTLGALATQIAYRDPLCSDIRFAPPSYMIGSCVAGLNTGEFVYMSSTSSGVPIFTLANPANPTTMPAIGIVEYKPSSTSCVVRPLSVLGEFTSSGMTAGATIVVGSDGKPASIGGGNYPAAGSTIQNVGLALSATNLLIYPALGAQSSAGGDLDYVNIAAGTNITNTTDETTTLSYTIPANVLRAGSKIEIDFAGTVTEAQSSDTFEPILKVGITTLVGATDLLAHAALNSTTADIFTGKGTLICRSTTSMYPVGNSVHGPAASATPLPWTNAAVTYDASLALMIALRGAWSVAHADNQAQGEILRVRVKR
jgi:hypothetical protein